MLSSRFRSYPVVDDYGHVAGLISRFHLIRPARKRVILVDHNEMSQSFPGLEQAEIIEIIDHHRIGDVTTDGPIYVRNEPVGSTATIIASMYFERNIFIDRPIAGILLAAILSDTIFFKSPTCTLRDREIAQKLSILSGENIDILAEAMFTPDDSLLKMSAKELLSMDFKVFRMAGAKVAIAQISAMDISPFLARQDDLLAQMDIDRKLEDYDMVMMALTDIEKGGSQILVSGSLGDAIVRAYGEEARGRNSFYLPGVMSRKKQIVPQLSMVVGIG
jgi:manganese-dependent inorganic pyrophosphatase